MKKAIKVAGYLALYAIVLRTAYTTCEDIGEKIVKILLDRS